MLTNDQIAIINATVPAVGAHAREITDCFYPLMFERYPEVKAFFNETHQAQGAQRQALANAVVAYAKNIERLEALGDAVSLIAQKHCSLGIQPEHYPIVGECLMAAIGEVLGEAVTEEVADAWGAAYQQLADILIGVEANIYQANRERCGGWVGDKVFKVVKKVQESDVITSFYLQPVEGEGPIEFTPGQYITLILDIDGETVRRNYSLSDAPGKQQLRISVKREEGGRVSNYLHGRVEVGSELRVTAPCGDFVLQDSQRPLFLVTGGVGITPAVSMLNAAVASGRDIHFIHSAINGSHHAFKAQVDELTGKHSNLKTCYVYEKPQQSDEPHYEGFLNREVLEERLPEDRDVDFYFLGPKPFMQAVNGFARELGVPQNQVRYEFFGPLQEL
ncbi:NO-inducible flavohemoprotein [Aestuariicella sp. G3-2]|uniref:NO-inducible flavohemoprotein n=1 Tax=Pseudomaricurvus albidus TaxID=2842452 RepID=UPI001C0DA379|nr:NO-inducible flavohemoprotein [Aestuariicella albida]MBU3070949.1 NO-inducible flavohemoprotein [Aestuariicella albida]